MYYLRTKPAAAAIQFTVDKSKLKEAATTNGSAKNGEDGMAGKEDAAVATLEKNMAAMVCSLQNKDDCLSCGS